MQQRQDGPTRAPPAKRPGSHCPDNLCPTISGSARMHPENQQDTGDTHVRKAEAFTSSWASHTCPWWWDSHARVTNIHWDAGSHQHPH